MTKKSDQTFLYAMLSIYIRRILNVVLGVEGFFCGVGETRNVDYLFLSYSSSSMLYVVWSAVTLFFLWCRRYMFFYATGNPGIRISASDVCNLNCLFIHFHGPFLKDFAGYERMQ